MNINRRILTDPLKLEEVRWKMLSEKEQKVLSNLDRLAFSIIRREEDIPPECIGIKWGIFPEKDINKKEE